MAMLTLCSSYNGVRARINRMKYVNILCFMLLPIHSHRTHHNTCRYCRLVYIVVIPTLSVVIYFNRIIGMCVLLWCLILRGDDVVLKSNLAKFKFDSEKTFIFKISHAKCSRITSYKKLVNFQELRYVELQLRFFHTHKQQRRSDEAKRHS